MSAATARLDAMALRAISEGPLTTAALARLIGCAPRAAYDAAARLVRAGRVVGVEGDGLFVRWHAKTDAPALAPRNDPR